MASHTLLEGETTNHVISKAAVLSCGAFW